MSDRAAIAMALAAVLGAWAARPVPLSLGLALALLAFVAGRPWLLVLAVAISASALGVRAWDGLADPPTGPVAGEVTLVGDPESMDGGRVEVDVRHRGKRWQAVASGPAAEVLAKRLAGERVTVDGWAGPLPPDAPWLSARHVVGRLRIDDLDRWRPGNLPSRAANGIRRHLAHGAAVLGSERQALFTGIVYGDDRNQSDVVAGEFRAAGLTHLLAVSGQNVAYVLLLVQPLTARLRLGPRWAVTVAVIAFFALLTRFEPSVLRASVMAGLAVSTAAIGRTASSVRLLSLAVAALVLIDPLLVRSVAFQLSAAASAGILLLAGPVARAVPGPRPLVLALAVTVAAQAGVAPILVLTFGDLPLAAVPANVLAAPATGPVTTWGIPAGLVAGFSAPLAGLLHAPTRVLLAWIEWVASEVPPALPGSYDLLDVAAIAALGVTAHLLRRRGRLLAVLPALLLLAVAVTPTLPRPGPPATLTLGAGADLWTGSDGSTVLVVDGRARPRPLLDELRAARVRGIDLLVVRSPSARAVDVGEAVAAGPGAATTLGPDPTSVGAWRVGCLEVHLTAPNGPAEPLAVEVDHVTDRGCEPPG